MHGLNWKRLSVLACAVALNPVTALLAQDAAGVVRITDRGPKSAAMQSGVQPAAMHIPGQYHAMPAAVGMMGQPNGAYAGDCPDCYGGYGKVGKSGTFKEHYCTHSPDHGFSVPGKWPIHRRGVQYTNFYPSVWAGTEGPAVADVPAYPMVYMPTDTTQLGFYYQHVPFWQPQPNPMPKRPIPAQWHTYAPTVSASAWGGGYGGYGANCPVNGTVINSTTASPTPIAQPAQPAAPMQAAPEAPRPLPPGPDET